MTNKPHVVLLVVIILAIVTTSYAQQPTPPQASTFEIWAMDQGTHVVHIFDPEFNELGYIEMEPHDVRVPHMIEFTSDYRYAFIAAPATGNTAVIRTSDYEVVAVIPTGPRTHHAAVVPGDRSVLVSVIGAADALWDGKLVEINLDLDRERFTVGRELVLADDSVFAARQNEFLETGGAVCAAFTQEGRYAYVTLGPELDEGGAVVLDMDSFQLTTVYPPSELDVNCGTIPSPSGDQMFLIGGASDVGAWHVMDTHTHQPLNRADSHGHDAHGSAVSPDGSEYWIVNRVTSNAIVVDPETLEIIDEVGWVGKTPDIVAFSPDGSNVYITLRGPNPVTMPHVAVGETPGIAVIDRSTRELIRLVEPAQDNPQSDFHGIAVRPRD